MLGEAAAIAMFNALYDESIDDIKVGQLQIKPAVVIENGKRTVTLVNQIKFDDMVSLSEFAVGNRMSRNQSIMGSVLGEGINSGKDHHLGLLMGPLVLLQDTDAIGRMNQNIALASGETGKAVPLVFDKVLEMGVDRRRVQLTDDLTITSQFSPGLRSWTGGYSRHLEMRNATLLNDTDLADRLYGVYQCITKQNKIIRTIRDLRHTIERSIAEIDDKDLSHAEKADLRGHVRSRVDKMIDALYGRIDVLQRVAAPYKEMIDAVVASGEHDIKKACRRVATLHQLNAVMQRKEVVALSDEGFSSAYLAVKNKQKTTLARASMDLSRVVYEGDNVVIPIKANHLRDVRLEQELENYKVKLCEHFGCKDSDVVIHKGNSGEGYSLVINKNKLDGFEQVQFRRYLNMQDKIGSTLPQCVTRIATLQGQLMQQQMKGVKTDVASIRYQLSREVEKFQQLLIDSQEKESDSVSLQEIFMLANDLDQGLSIACHVHDKGRDLNLDGLKGKLQEANAAVVLRKKDKLIDLKQMMVGEKGTQWLHGFIKTVEDNLPKRRMGFSLMSAQHAKVSQKFILKLKLMAQTNATNGDLLPEFYQLVDKFCDDLKSKKSVRTLGVVEEALRQVGARVAKQPATAMQSHLGERAAAQPRARCRRSMRQPLVSVVRLTA